MIGFIYHLSTFAPLVIFIASALDIFFATGLILYGAAMMGSVAMMYANNMISLEAIIISAYSGTLLGNSFNFLVGQYFSEKEFVKRKLNHPRVASARNLLESRGLFLFMLVSRFITFTRPVYAILLGSLGIKYYRFIIYELFIALFWVVFWLMVIVKGIDIYAWIFN